MSTLKTNNIANVAGTQSTDVLNVINGSAKAWVNFNGTGTVAIRAAYNVSSITDAGTGQYQVNFTTSFADTNFTPIVTASDEAAAPTSSNIQSAWTTFTLTSGVRVISNTTAGGGADRSYFGVAVFR